MSLLTKYPASAEQTAIGKRCREVMERDGAVTNIMKTGKGKTRTVLDATESDEHTFIVYAAKNAALARQHAPIVDAINKAPWTMAKDWKQTEKMLANPEK